MKVLVFGAVWCPECIIMKPILEEIQSEIKILRLNIMTAMNIKN